VQPLKSKKQKKKKFIRKPHLEGGKEYLKEFLKENLVYPKEALEKGIQGDVLVSFSVNHYGIVSNPHIVKGIGYGCDEEAIRLVSMLRYQEVKNRGLRVSVRSRVKIPFKLKEVKKTMSISYTTTPGTKKADTNRKKTGEPGTTYTYTIEI